MDSVWSGRVDNLASATLEAVYTYDDNHGGKMSQVILGNTVQTLNYTYSIRDWLKSVNSNQFSQTLKYDDATVNPRYNGNIAQMTWNTAGNAGAYDFTYDGANRLTDAVTTSGPDFSEKLISYDANGNILTLKRGTSSPINYSYDVTKPNQLTSVTGGLSATYTYDGNGNMTNDNTKGTITYDYRNMPIRITTNDTVIEYAYDAAGQRIRKTLKNNESTLSETIFVRGLGGNVLAEYATGSIDHFNIYGNGLIGKLEPAIRTTTIQNQTINGQTITAKDSVIILPESNVEGESTVQADQAQLAEDKRYYFLPDHLGSTRVVLKEDGNIEVTYDYFPHGKISRSTESANSPKEKYTGKQHDDESSLDYFGARYYNADVVRWITKDPLAEKYPDLSPYVYSLNNPVSYKDPDGRFVVNANGTAVYRVSPIAASTYAIMGAIPGGNYTNFIHKLLRNDPSYSIGASDYANLAVGGILARSSKYVAEASGLLGLNRIGVDLGFGLAEVQDQSQLVTDEMTFRMAGGLGYGYQNISNPEKFHVNKSFLEGTEGKVSQELVETEFKDIGNFIQQEATADKVNMKNEKMFKIWFNVNKNTLISKYQNKKKDDERRKKEEEEEESTE